MAISQGYRERRICLAVSSVLAYSRRSLQSNHKCRSPTRAGVSSLRPPLWPWPQLLPAWLSPSCLCTGRCQSRCYISEYPTAPCPPTACDRHSSSASEPSRHSPHFSNSPAPVPHCAASRTTVQAPSTPSQPLQRAALAALAALAAPAVRGSVASESVKDARTEFYCRIFAMRPSLTRLPLSLHLCNAFAHLSGATHGEYN